MPTLKGNTHDSKTLEETLNVHQRIVGKRAAEAAVDRKSKGAKQAGDTIIHSPTKSKKSDCPYQKSTKRKRFRRRSAIETIIGHTKAVHKMARSFLKGFKEDVRNALLAAAFNFRRWIRKSISWLDFRISFLLTIRKNNKQKPLGILAY